MERRKLRAAQKKGDCGTNLTDYISKMPDDVLVMILSYMPIKYAAVTSTLSTRWRFLWRNLIHLNFDGSEDLDKTGDDWRLCEGKFINQVFEVIRSYNHPKVQSFRIRFYLVGDCSAIDYWIQFALEKKVEKLELDLHDKRYRVDVEDWYVYYYVSIPSCYSTIEETLLLKNLSLKNVTLTEDNLQGILKNAPFLEILGLYHSVLQPHNNVGGQDINLKHFTIVSCVGLKSISVSGFDLVSFIYSGPEIGLHLHDLPKLKEVDIGGVSVGLENNVFRQMSLCALISLEVLILDICSPMKGLDVNAIPKLPNVKKLKLLMRAEEDDSLLEFTSIARACPSLERFSISLHWYTPTKRRGKLRRVATPHAHKHLKLLEIIGYYGRISDLELAVYVIENAVALKKITIDPRCHAADGNLTTEESLKRQEAARSSAKRQLTPILPPGVELLIR